jgi:Uma2 family endonuclease
MTAIPVPRPQPPKPVPPLQNGDRLTAEEFERRFNAMRGLTRAELIDGVVYMPPPVSDEDHGSPQFDLTGWLAMYRYATPGVMGGIGSTLRLDARNRPQPDAFLRIIPECGGRARRDVDGYLVAPPDLICEVAASSASYDLGVKLDLYRRIEVREYVAWRVYDGSIDWRVLRNGVYEPLMAGPDGILRSEVFPGLWLDSSALMSSDVAALLRAAQQGLASPEHSAFVSQPQQARESRTPPADPKP